MKKIHVSAAIWRTLAVLVAALLFTAYLTSYLAARFATVGDGSDSARVAKWDYEVIVDAGNFLGTGYADSDSSASTAASVVADGYAGTLSVKGSTDLVTPNTSGYITFTCTGGAVAEVAAKLWIYSDYSVPYITVGSTTYYPILWTLTADTEMGDTTLVDGGTLDAVTAALNSVGTLPNTEINRTYTISWEWPLESGNDILDTAMMLYAAGYSLSDSLERAGYDVPDGAESAVHTALSLDITLHIEQIN